MPNDPGLAGDTCIDQKCVPGTALRSQDQGGLAGPDRHGRVYSGVRLR